MNAPSGITGASSFHSLTSVPPPPAISELGSNEGPSSASSPLWLPSKGESGHWKARILLAYRSSTSCLSRRMIGADLRLLKHPKVTSRWRIGLIYLYFSIEVESGAFKNLLKAAI